MPIPAVKRAPPPPRRAPPAAALANLTHDGSEGAYAATTVQLKISGVALTSQRLIQTKDSVNDIKVALATADDTIQRVVTSPALLGGGTTDSAKGGVDIQSLQFAASTRAKLAEQEQKQDAHYANLSESAVVAQEVRKAAQDPSLRRCSEAMECQMAASTFPGARFPRGQGASHPIPPEEAQALLNPFSTARRQSRSGALTAMLPMPAISSTNNGSSMGGASTSAPPVAMANEPYRVVSGMHDGGAYPPTVTRANIGGGRLISGNAVYYAENPYPPRGQPQPVYGQYGQRQPVGNQQNNGRPAYMAL
ncbi:hypothetical protein ABB37_04359 [Leptomonas pyrrhocoris]|uniref:Uncharacterized protein n=1 Tax=Leptomonas pyrrhocoris TaxID=157538 RepID=A0A0N0VFE9_LEPPY|nr:hypothetical protein ABB37_04359 [Leptomonas pyrrhocoris]KPA80971.1 hypothetical protein ABB37_04359 [Leptomonas pyrrhocoris]|eukprot:XP_015659410.1 hypothetical protein ABB37_04359 [Leptomonas pyrrhocoris]